MLPLPSIEVLAEVAGSQARTSIVVHVLESFVVTWMKLIKVTQIHSIASNLNPSMLCKLMKRLHSLMLLLSYFCTHIHSVIYICITTQSTDIVNTT